MLNFPNLKRLIDLAIEEDLGDAGDITSESIFTGEEHLFSLISKETGILCGIDVFSEVMKRVDGGIKVVARFSDGDMINKGDLIAEISGKVTSILKAERTSLNFLSLLSAVATRTRFFVDKAGGRLKVLDTRKTIPGFRDLQKYAVRCGGGVNHRMGLHDMVMIKDNHIDAAGGITKAVKRVRKKWGNRYKIEVETRSMAEVTEALSCMVDRIMLDNMSDSEMSEAVAIIGGRCQTEASGNITPERAGSIEVTGVDFISAGELTNSIKSFDFSLKGK